MKRILLCVPQVQSFFSIIMVAHVDAEYGVRWVNVSDGGSTSDCTVHKSQLCKALEQGILDIPPAEPLPGDDKNILYITG